VKDVDYIIKTSRYSWIILSEKTWLLNYTRMTIYRSTWNIKVMQAYSKIGRAGWNGL
jgi:hypothetical protein